MVACQPTPEEASAPANGMVLQGEYEGRAFEIATGEIDDIMMELIDAFNNMDAEALWAHSADTITFFGSDGTVGPMTQSDMAGFMATLDSVRWDPVAIIPVKAVGSDRTQVLVEGRETMYYRDGTVHDIKLFERFTFVDGTLMEIRQWEAAVEPAGNTD